MSGVNNRTLDLEKLFVRDIIFKDASNRPIPAHQVLYSRGDGGTYFGNPPSTNSTFNGAFNKFRAGSTVTILGQDAQNTLWFQPGSGIEYHLDTSPTIPQLYISALAPEQIVVNGGGAGTLNFSSLTDTLHNGRTLYFAGEGDTTVNISDTTVRFGSQYNSSLSSVQELSSTLTSSLAQQSTLNTIIISTLSTVDTLLLSTGVAAIYSTCAATNAAVDDVSTFVFSTFTLDSNGNRNTLNINQINTNIINISTIVAQDISTQTLNIGSNAFSEYNATNDSINECIVITSTGIASTTTNYLNITDAATHVHAAFQKQYITSKSTFGASTFETYGEQVQLGFFPFLSTPGSTLPPTLSDRFVPILQQIEVLEQTVSGGVSTQTNYSLQNIAKLDIICANKDQLVLQGDVVISTLEVSTINGIDANKFGGSASTFSFINTDAVHPSTVGAPVTISSITVQYINGMPYGTFSTLDASTINTGNISASVIIVEQTSISSATISTITNDQFYGGNATIGDISTNHISTGAINYGNASGDSISTNNLSTGNLSFGAGNGSSLNVVYISTGSANIPDINVSSINGFDFTDLGRSTYSTLFWSTAVGLNATVSSLRISTVMGFDLPIFTFDMANRRVGVNLGATQQPRATIDVSGIVYANNFVTTSDRRLKSTITEMLPISSIPKAYRYTNLETGEADIGVMADEIEAILPECVYTRPDGYKSVSYIKLVPVCLSMIKALTERLSVLERLHSL